MKIKTSISDIIGNTPIFKIKKENPEYADILLKLEFLNPSGSVKDRTALSMIQAAQAEGLLKKGGLIVEPTSGNTGIGLAMLAAAEGYKAVIVMPDNMSKERIDMFKIFGAEVVLTDGKLGMKGAIEKAEEICKSNPNSYMPQQFENPANPLVHERTTALEIWNDTDAKVDIFVAGVGTGGTLIGTGRALKKLNPKIEVVAVEPKESQVLLGGQASSHSIQGIGANFVPKIYDKNIVDRVVNVASKDALEMAKFLCQKQGLPVGISSGAAFKAASDLACMPENKGKVIVAIMPDSANRYFSTLI